jgi:unsaturated chondroitin disaccharide hydrolase
MWQPTAVTDYRLTGDKASRSRGLHAASLLAARYNPAGRFIRAWEDSPEQDRRGWAIIDCMMNLSILYWASEETRDPRFRIVAENYADTVKDNFIRPDGSSNHIVEFDPEKGGKVRTWGGQGYANGSAWTRGQGWAIYGFVISFLHTKREIYLDTSMRTADFFLAHMPKSGIIPIDFLQPEEPALEDSCGACIAASGLIKLAECCRRQGKTEETAEKYYKAGLRILKAVGESRADWTKDCDAIVQECAADYHSDGHHMTMIYADYFFMEAVFTLAGKGLFIW